MPTNDPHIFKRRKTHISNRPSQSEAANPPREYIVPAADALGHSVRIPGYNGPPEFARMMNVILASKLFPYKNWGDINRDALARLLRELVKKLDDPETAAVMRTLNRVTQLLSFEAEKRMFNEGLDAACRMLDLHIADGNTMRARFLTEEISIECEQFPEPHYRRVWLKTMERYRSRISEIIEREEKQEDRKDRKDSSRRHVPHVHLHR